MKISRRKFLKLAGSGIAIVVLGGTVWRAFSNGVFSSGQGPSQDRVQCILFKYSQQMISGNSLGLYRKIKAIDKKVKVCFLTSVYDFNRYRTRYPDIIETVEKNEDCILDKPVGSEQLIRGINRISCRSLGKEK